MYKVILSALVVLAFGATPLSAQIKLEWKFTEGATFFVERAYTQKQTVETKNKLLKEQRSKTWVLAVKVKEKTASGQALDLTIESVAIASDAKGGLEDALAAKMKGARFSATVTPQGRLAQFGGYEPFIQKLAEKNADTEKVLRALLSEEAIREDIEELFHFLPDKSVRKGDQWKRESIEPVPPFGSFKSTFAYALEDDKNETLPISYTIKMAYKPPGADSDLFRVIKGTLSAEDGQGSLRFDVKRDGTLANGHIFVNLGSDPRPGNPDGLKTDKDGNVYTAGPGGLWVFSPAGKHIASLNAPAGTRSFVNFTFGGDDGKTMYMTTPEALFSVAFKTSRR